MVSIGLTGNVASGKSSVARVWSERGIPTLSADALAREVVEPGSEGLHAVRAEFGNGVLGADGSLDRAALRALVFRDADARRRLEGILHPLIAARRQAWMATQRERGAHLVVYEIPLLFETAQQDQFDVIVLVHAPAELRVRRLVEDRGLTRSEAQQMVAAQISSEEKRPGSDIVIENMGSPAELDRAASAALDRIMSGMGETTGVERGASESVDASEEQGTSGSSVLRIDFHMHTRGSHDCLSDPEEVLRSALGRGVRRIAITDHNELSVALEMASRHPDEVIPGEEVKTAEGIDVIGLYLRELIPKGTPAVETCERIREQGGIAYLPHPFARGKGGGGTYVELLVPHIDVIEVHNGRLRPASLNARAEAVAEESGLLRAGGTDAHTIREVARSWVELPYHPNEPAALLNALREGRVHGRTSHPVVHVASTWAKVRKRLPF